MKHLVSTLTASLVLTGLIACSGTAAQTPESTPTPGPDGGESAVLFDDFTYPDRDALVANGWIVRTEPGWPGVSGATWSDENVTLVDDPDAEDNRLVQMVSSTDGTTTTQTQLCQQRKFYEGTYATRVRFSDAPDSGPDGDNIVETFYMISPLQFDLDPNYSEMDYEYLPNGGWGTPGPVFFATTWETFRPEPNWLADNASDSQSQSFDGWHTLVLQVADGDVTYYVDGEQLAQHGGKYYPEVAMSINYNLWFISGGQIRSNTPRDYVEQIDWVFYQAGTALSPDEVEAQVTALRDGGVAFMDTVPEWDPPLESPCNF